LWCCCEERKYFLCQKKDLSELSRT
jgi:hypothetical protein